MVQADITLLHNVKIYLFSLLSRLQVKIWFQNRRSKYKKLMKTGPGGAIMTGGGPLSGGGGAGGPSSPPPGGSPMGMAHTPTGSQGQMSPSSGIHPPSNHSPGGASNNSSQQQQQQQHQLPPHSHGGSYIPQPTPSPAGGDMSPGQQQQQQQHQQQHPMAGSGSPPLGGGWPPHLPPGAAGMGMGMHPHFGGGGHHQQHQQHHHHHQGHHAAAAAMHPSSQHPPPPPPDIKPPPMMNPHNMFPQYSWYQSADNNMNQGLLT